MAAPHEVRYPPPWREDRRELCCEPALRFLPVKRGGSAAAACSVELSGCRLQVLGSGLTPLVGSAVHATVAQEECLLCVKFPRGPN